jgi:hypothetical protein
MVIRNPLITKNTRTAKWPSVDCPWVKTIKGSDLVFPFPKRKPWENKTVDAAISRIKLKLLLRNSRHSPIVLLEFIRFQKPFSEENLPDVLDDAILPLIRKDCSMNISHIFHNINFQNKAIIELPSIIEKGDIPWG